MLDQILKWLPIATTILSVLAAWAALTIRATIVQRADLTQHAEANARDIAALDRRMTVLETHVEHAPSEDDLIRLHARIDALASEVHSSVGHLSGQVQRLVGESSGMRGLLETIHHHLMGKTP